MKLRVCLIGGAVFALVFLWGCSGYHEPSKAPERVMLVGTYIFSYGGQPHSPDRLTLEANGRYVLVHMSESHPGRKEEGRWQLFHDDLGWKLGFGTGLWPIEVKGQHVRILINDDLGWWYEKSIALRGHKQSSASSMRPGPG